MIEDFIQKHNPFPATDSRWEIFNNDLRSLLTNHAKSEAEEASGYKKALTGILDSANPHTLPARSWPEIKDFTRHIGSLSMPSDESIIDALVVINKYKSNG